MFNRRQLLMSGFVSALLPPAMPAPPAVVLTEELGRVVLAAASRLVGVPYRAGAATFPRTADCSSLTQAAYAASGIVIPRSAAAQFTGCTRRCSLPGALVFFNTPGMPDSVTHVGVNDGRGGMVNANPLAGCVLRESWETSRFWMRRFVGCLAF